MIVIQRCEFQRAPLAEPVQSDTKERDESESSRETRDSEMFSLTGRDLNGREIAWVICGQHIRSLNFPLKRVVVPSQYIEKFVISGHSPQVYTVWLRAVCPIPTRVRPPRGGRQVPVEEQPGVDSLPDNPSRIPMQNMELGTVFGAVPLEKVLAGLDRLGYQVAQCTWDELLAESGRQ